MMQAQEVVLPGEVASTWEDVCRRYPDQWVVLVETDWIDSSKLDFRSTRVVGHGAHRTDVLALARPLTARCQGFGCFFTGRIRAPLHGFFAP
jgi:hypothetical protein